MTNPITASRERIVRSLIDSHILKHWDYEDYHPDIAGRQIFEDEKKTVLDALLQHEAVVREEMERSFEQIISYIREVDPDDDNKQMRHIFDIAEAAIRTTQPTI